MSPMRLVAVGAVVLSAVALALPGAGSGVGESLLVLSHDGRIYVARADGSGLTELGPGGSPSFSPDGTRIAYVDGDLWVLDRSNGARTRITATPASEGPPVWSADGTRLAFASFPPGAPAELWVAQSDGSAARRLAADAVATFTAPSWSPDGLELAYATTRGTSGDVAVVRADGSGRRLLTDDDQVDSAPQWSPDGQSLAFLRSAPASVEATLHVIAKDGGGLRRVTATPVWPTGDWGSWSPDGRRIAFADLMLLGVDPRTGPYYSSTIRIVDVTDGAERAITPGGHPSWSPDGARIAYGGVYVMNAAGTCRTLVLAGTLGATPWSGPSAPPAAPLRCADLSLSLRQDRNETAQRGEVRVELTVRNRETETATGVRLQVDAPSGGSLTSLTTDSGSCSAAACDLGALPVGQIANATAVFKADGVGPVQARARVRANEPDGYPDNEAQIGFEALPCSLVGTWGPDRLTGTEGPDTICARPGADLIFGLAGVDRIDAGNGDDVVVPGPGGDRIDLRGGRDVVDARDGRPDVITCGGGADIALVDRFDLADRECEVVSRTKLLCRRPNSWLVRGTFRADVLVGSPDRRLPDSLCGFSGNDTLVGLGGDDALDGGSGNDTLQPGPGRDLMLGGAGNDTIEARDHERDRVRCGSEFDVVTADPADSVAPDCERVRRSHR